MADHFKRKRADYAQVFMVDPVREPNDAPVDGTGLVKADIDFRIVRMEDGVSIIDENVDAVITTNPLRINWKAAVNELDVPGGEYGVSLLIRFATGEERFPVTGFIPLIISDNAENLPT